VTIREALAEAERRFAAAGIDTPRVDAEWLVAHVLGVPRSQMRTRDDIDEASLEPLIRRREQREPLAYVLGEWGFRRLTLKTDRRALVPRPETETLVERALALIADVDAPRVLDIGVGSGAIALAIADEYPSAQITGVDTSADALALARENAAALGVDIELREGGVEAAADGWDLVVSNPPYVRANDWDALQPEIREWEPRGALVGDGMYEAIADAADTRAIAFEVGDGDAQRVANVLAGYGYATRITRDLAGRGRIVEGQRS
jgi:release factor glutamine methyltransferase